MNFIKKYSALLIPVGIIIVAVLLFIPTILTGRTLRGDMEDSVSKGKQLSSLLRSVVSKAQAEQEALYQNKHEKDAGTIEQLGRQTTRRELINYNIFPKPKETSRQIFFEFGRKYRTMLEDLVKSINALDAPGDLDLQKHGDGTGRRTVVSRAGQSKKSSIAIIDAICRKRAESISVYANPNMFKWYEFWDDYGYIGFDTAIEDCWYSQVSCWVYEDVAATIKAMNTGSSCVYTSPVKRLLGVNFEKNVGYGFRKAAAQSSAGGDRPKYITNLGMTPLRARPWTGRVCNDTIDVIHFSLAVVVESKSVIPFIKQLCSEKEHKYREGYSEDGPEKDYKHNQITVLRSSIESVDPQGRDHKQHRYGNNAVVRLNLTCEYIFGRAGYDKIKPMAVREALFNPVGR